MTAYALKIQQQLFEEYNVLTFCEHFSNFHQPIVEYSHITDNSDSH